MSCHANHSNAAGIDNKDVKNLIVFNLLEVPNRDQIDNQDILEFEHQFEFREINFKR